MPIRQRLAVGIFRTPLVEPTAAMTLAGAYQRFGSPNSPSARAKNYPIGTVAETRFSNRVMARLHLKGLRTLFRWIKTVDLPEGV